MGSGWLRKNIYAAPSADSSLGRVTPLPFVGPDEDLVEALRKGHPGAAKAFYDRYADIVERVVWRILGGEDDVPALIHEAFLRAIAGVERLRDSASLQTSVVAAAVATVRSHLRRRARGRFLARLHAPRPQALEGTVERVRPARVADPLHHAMEAFYDVLGTLPVEDRIVLALRVVDAMPLAEIAEVNRVSLGRLKRRLRRADTRFVVAARQNTLLRPWLDRGTRWTLPTLD
jgi:RNA polymerase sigma-70 factor (ECF subfamily)